MEKRRDRFWLWWAIFWLYVFGVADVVTFAEIREENRTLRLEVEELQRELAKNE